MKIGIPRFATADHRVEDDQQFAHAGRERDLLGFSCGDQSLEGEAGAIKVGVWTTVRDKQHAEWLVRCEYGHPLPFTSCTDNRALPSASAGHQQVVSPPLRCTCAVQ